MDRRWFLSALLCAACAPGLSPSRPGYDRDMGGYPEQTLEKPSGYEESGMVSYYADKFHGRKTASGEIFDKRAFTAAHRTLPFRTKVKVTNLENGKSVVVMINDRGPFSRNRILDLSPTAAREIGLGRQGTVRAKITVL